MNQGKTIYEMVRDWLKGIFNPELPKEPPEKSIFNPLNAKLGTSISVDAMDYRQFTFIVKELRENKLDYGPKKFHFTDYICRSALHEGEPFDIKVRVYKHDKPGHDLQTLVLKLWDTIDYDEGFKNLLGNEQFDLLVDGQVQSSFWRMNGAKKPYKVRVTNWDESGIKTIDRQFWDYSGVQTDRAGSEFKEFLFIDWDEDGKDDGELDENTGRFELWRGEEVVQTRISTI